jgi:hypothetical protein
MKELRTSRDANETAAKHAKDGPHGCRFQELVVVTHARMAHVHHAWWLSDLMELPLFLPPPPAFFLSVSLTCTFPRRNTLKLLTVAIELRKLRNKIDVHEFLFGRLCWDGIVGPVESAANQAFRRCTFSKDMFLRETMVRKVCVCEREEEIDLYRGGKGEGKSSCKFQIMTCHTIWLAALTKPEPKYSCSECSHLGLVCF